MSKAPVAAVAELRSLLAPPEYKTRHEGKKLYVEARIPLKTLGSTASGKVRFNLGRNRMVDGNLEAYTFVTGRKYLNFEGAELEF